jgi:autophagy-related protein 9
VYEAIQQHDAGSDSSDVEDRASLAPRDDRQEGFSDRELEDALADAGNSGFSSSGAGLMGRRESQADRYGSPSKSRRRKPSKPRWMPKASSAGYDLDDRDEDVPLSLLVEGNDEEELKARLPPPPHSMPSRSITPSPQPSPMTRHHLEGPAPRQTSDTISENQHPLGRWFLGQQHPSLANIDPKKKAMWRWANVEDLDNFLKDVYIYFLGNGFWSILLSRALNLL